MVRRTSAAPDEIAERPSVAAISAPDASNAVDAWLNVFVRLLHLRDSQRQAIRDELAEHLRERTRDVMLGGCSETDAVRLAIEELGETAALAKRFEAANRPQRRLLMHLSLLGLSAGVITLGVVALSPNQPRVPAAMFESMRDTTAPPEQMRDLKVNVDFKDSSLEDVVKYYADLAKRSAIVRWPELEEAGLTHDSVINLQARNIRLAKAFELVAEELSRSGAAIEWRFDDDMIELGTREHFDLRDIALVSYDISTIVQSIGAQYGLEYNAIIERVVELIQTMVEPTNWRGNGGSLAHLQIVGGKLFVEAPKRMHTRVDWILEQLRDGAAPAAEGDAPKRINLRPEPRSTLEPGDTVEVSIFELYQPSAWATSSRDVQSDGTLRLPVLGEIKVAGHNLDYVEKRIVAKLEQTVMKNPNVTVTSPTLNELLRQSRKNADAEPVSKLEPIDIEEAMQKEPNAVRGALDGASAGDK